VYAAVNLKQNVRTIYCTIEANDRHEPSRGFFATAELLVLIVCNKCIEDDTKAAARQSLNCIKNKK